VQVSGHVRVVDYNLQPVDLGLKGNDPSDLAPYIAIGSESLQWDSSQEVQKKLSFTMLDPADDPLKPVQLGFNPLHHFLQISTTFSCLGVMVEFPLGTFFMDWPQVDLYRGYRIYTFAGLDLTSLIAEAEFMSDWVCTTVDYGTGTKGTIQAAIDMITSDGVPKSLNGQGQTRQGNDDAGPGIPVAYLDVDWSGNLPLAIPIIAQAGGSRITDGINALMESIQYYPIVMSNATRFRMRPMPDFLTSKPKPFWNYSTDGHSIVRTVHQEFQYSSVMANVFRVEGGQAAANGGASLSSVQANQSADSQISLVNMRTLGGGPRAIARYERNTNLTTQAMVDQYCRMRLNGGDVITDKVTLTTLVNPLTDAYDYYVLNVTSKDGETRIFSDEDHPYLCVGWTMPFLSPDGEMQQTLIRAEAL
jgi:hypothetical protein